MSRQILKAAAAALAAAGALATAGPDAVALVQHEVGLHTAKVNQGVLGAFTGMLSAMQLESSISAHLGAFAGDEPGKCTPADKEQLKLRMEKVNAKAEKEGAEAVMKSLPEECSKIMGVGVPDFNQMGTCMQKFLGVSPSCVGCTTSYLKSVTNLFGGCVAGCMPLAMSCKDGTSLETATEGCKKATKSCLKCNHPHYKKYSKCVGGSPNSDKVLRKVDEVYDQVAEDKIKLEDGAKQIAEVAEKEAEMYSK